MIYDFIRELVSNTYFWEIATLICTVLAVGNWKWEGDPTLFRIFAVAAVVGCSIMLGLTLPA